MLVARDDAPAAEAARLRGETMRESGDVFLQEARRVVVVVDVETVKLSSNALFYFKSSTGSTSTFQFWGTKDKRG